MTFYFGLAIAQFRGSSIKGFYLASIRYGWFPLYRGFCFARESVLLVAKPLAYTPVRLNLLSGALGKVAAYLSQYARCESTLR